jgi:hypothetical protein
MMTKLPFSLSVMFLSALGCAQILSLPEPLQVQAKNHVVSLTLHPVNENARDAFAFDGETVAQSSALHRVMFSKSPTSTIFLPSLRRLVR